MTANEDEPDIDEFVLKGDVLALVVYGCAQGFVDALLSPLATANPDMFENDLPIEYAAAQGCLVAVIWVCFALVTEGYSFDKTRNNFIESLLACAVPWIGSCAFILSALVFLNLNGVGPGANPGEVEFIIGSGTVVGAWRFVCSQLPPI